MIEVQQMKEQVLTGSKKKELINQFKETSSVITDKLIPQYRAEQSMIVMNKSDEKDGAQQAAKSDLSQQIEHKISALETINQNVNQNIELLNKVPTENKDEEYMLEVENQTKLTDLYSESKTALDNIQELINNGINQLQIIKAKKKPKKKSFWQKFGLIIVGVA